MDEIKLKKICQSALDISFSGVIISEFKAIPTQKFDKEKNDWVPDAYSIFIILKKPLPSDVFYVSGFENFFESLLGYECCVDAE